MKHASMLAIIACLFGCDPPKETTAAATASATAAPTTTAAPKTSAAAAPEKKPSHPCPDKSEGDGTRKKPCEAKGSERIMEVKWSGKITDKGPKFSVTNKSKLEILYGNLVVYFYDKAGKQIEIKEGDKTKKHIGCVGNIFAGAVKPGEKIHLWFSCVKKKHVPEGAVAIEAEIKTAGFTDASGKKSDTFWRNKELAPADRAKGGVK